MSSAVLAYEVLLMALFSLIQWHHFAYLVVSVALLGFGASGTALVFLAPRLRGAFRGFACSQACLFALSLPLGFALAQRLSFNPEELIWDPAHWLRLALLILLLMLPFFFAANLIGMALIEYRRRLARVYAADLFGAGIGALGVLGLLYLLPPQQALLWVAALGLGAAAASWIECGGRAWPALALLPAAVIVLQMLPQTWIEPRISTYKELSQILRIPGTRIVEQRSSPLGWLSVVESSRLPLRHAPGLSLKARAEPPAQLALFTDGGGLSAITRYRGVREDLRYLDDLTSALPYHLFRPGRMLLLGAGGGDGVLQAIYHEIRQIDAVEINPQVIALVRDRFAEFSGGVYSNPRVDLHVADARGFLERGDDRYDLIQVPLLDAFAGAGTHGLNQSYLYTVEALRQALQRLEPNGFLAFTRWLDLPPRDSLKLFASAIAALESSGPVDARQSLILIRGLQTSTLLIKNGAVGASEIDDLRRFCQQRGFDLAYYPGMPATEANRFNRLQSAYFFNAATALLGSEREQFLRQYKFDLRPATDDRPFHFHFVKWGSLIEILQMRQRGGSALLETGYLALLLTLLLGLGLSLLLILLPLLLLRASEAAAPVRFGKIRILAFFSALGLGFLLIEIAFLQKFILLLHHPLYSAAVVLASFLVAAGSGSAWVQRYAGSLRARRACVYAVCGIVLFGAAAMLLQDSLLRLAGAWPLAPRIVLAMLLIGPLGFCMGMPFALGMSAISIGSNRLSPWAWGINGCASVISAVLATILAIHFGFDFVILFAIACYIVAAIAFPLASGGLDPGLMVKKPAE